MIEFVKFDRRYLELSAVWLSDPETKELTQAPDITPEQQETFFASLADREDYKIWGVKCDELPVGAVGLKHITESDAEYWAYIGEKRYRGRGLGKDMLNFGVYKARLMELKSIYIKVKKNNVHSLSVHLNQGFKPDEMDMMGEIQKLTFEL